MATRKKANLSLVKASGNLELNAITATLKKFSVIDSTHDVGTGWHTTCRCAIDIPVKAEQLEGLEEYEIIAAMATVGFRQSESGGKTRTVTRIGRDMPMSSFTLEGDKGTDVSFIGAFKVVAVKAVKGELTLCLTVDGDIMAASLPTLAAFRGIDIKLSTTPTQAELALDTASAA